MKRPDVLTSGLFFVDKFRIEKYTNTLYNYFCVPGKGALRFERR